MKEKAIGREEFLARLKDKASGEEIALIEDAYTLAKYGHRNQLRDEGERYFEHPKAVAVIVVDELGIYNPEVIIMALLHDIIEDTFILSRKGLERLFGNRVVDGLDYLTKTSTRDEYIEKMKQCEDMSAIVVKYADRLHNLRTTSGILVEKKEKVFKETQDKYIPMLNEFINKAEPKDKASLEYLKNQIQNILE